PLRAVATQRARYRIVDLHVELRIVFERLAGLRIDALGPVQIIDVLSSLDELSVRAIQRIEEPVAAEMADDLASLATDGRVVEHVDADLVIVPRIVRCVLEMPGQFAGVDVEGHSRVGVEVVAGTRLRIVLRNRVTRAPDGEPCRGIVGACLPDAAATRFPGVILILPRLAPWVPGFG